MKLYQIVFLFFLIVVVFFDLIFTKKNNNFEFMENCTYSEFKPVDGICKNGFAKNNNMCYINSENDTTFSNNTRCDNRFDNIKGVTEFNGSNNNDYPLYYENDYAKIIIQTDNFPFLELDETELTVINTNNPNTTIQYDISYVVCDYSGAVEGDRLLDDKFDGLQEPLLNLDDFNFVNNIFIQSYKADGFFGNNFVRNIESNNNFFLSLIKSSFFSQYFNFLPNLGKKQMNQTGITTSSYYDNNVIKIMISYVTPNYSDNFTFTTTNSVNNKSFVFISDKLIGYNKSLALYHDSIQPVNDESISLESNKLYQLIWISFCPNKHTKYKINHNTDPQQINNIHQLSYTSDFDSKIRFFSNTKHNENVVQNNMTSLTKIDFTNCAILSFSNKFTLDESYKITAPVKNANTNIFMVHGDKYNRKVISKSSNTADNLEAKELNYEVKYNPDINNLTNTAIYFEEE